MSAFEYTAEIPNAKSAWRNKPEFLAEIDYPTDDEIAWEINNLRENEKSP